MRLWSAAAAINALKTTVGILAAWGIVLWCQWPTPYLAPLAVLFLQTPYLGASLRKGLMRVIGTLGGALVALLILSLWIQDRTLLMGANALVLGVSIYMMRNSRYAYAWFMAAIVVALISDAAALQPDQAFLMTVYRTSEALVGILVVLVINGLFWPRTAGPVYVRTYAEARAGLEAYLRRLAAAVVAPSLALPAPPGPKLLGAPEALREALTAAALDTASFRRLNAAYAEQIAALGAAIGALMAFGENLGLAAAGETVLLTERQRAALAEVLTDLAEVVAGMAPGGQGARCAPAPDPDPPTLAAARGRMQRLLADPDLRLQDPRQRAMLYAAADQMDTLIEDIASLAESAAVIARDGRPARRRAVPPAITWRAPLPERVAAALPNALLMAGAYLAAALIWIDLQWPPVSSLGIMMAVVIIGTETIQNIPALHPGRRLALGALAGLVVTAPLYVLVLPRLTGFTELALVLFPFYWVITYFMHLLPPPRQILFLGMGLMGIVMLQLEPVQTMDLAGWIGTGVSAMSGFVIGLVLLSVFRGMTPQERLRRLLRRLLADLRAAVGALADRGRPDFAQVLAQAEGRLVARFKELAQVIPLVYRAQVPQNSRERIDTLLQAAESALLRFRALQQARARWSGARDRGAPTTSLGETSRRAFEVVLGELVALLDDPGRPPSLTALDEARCPIVAELQRMAAQVEATRADGGAPAVYTLGIAGHYVGVARALRALATAMGAIDWAAWRVPRF